MSKTKAVYSCHSCGAQFPKWSGQCGSCGEWNCLTEEVIRSQTPAQNSRFENYAGDNHATISLLSDIAISESPRFTSYIDEFDRVLGGGLVPGSVVLIGGPPGIGKSTLLLQSLCYLSQKNKCLYITGEESLQQVTMRAERLGLPKDKLHVLSETHVEGMLVKAKQLQPKVIVIDSIQTIHTELLQSAPGSIGQVRESAAQLLRFAKQTNTTLLLVGHVTKEGSLAGPRVLEHMVDVVLYFEGERDQRFRMIRAVKNRFGAVNELGVFAMTDKGLKEVTNPSAIFLSRAADEIPGSAVLVSWEGSRPLLVEVQALVDESHAANPRRVTVGLDHNRLAMLLAVLHRHGGIVTYDQDVFVNVVGGVRVMETAVDLALLVAILSSLRNKPIPNDWVIFGEVGLAGEIRPVQSGQERLREAAKHGFKHALVAAANAPKQAISDMEVVAVTRLADALAVF